MPVFGKRRAYGQHFLNNSEIIHTIVDTTLSHAQNHGCRGLLEIGPGQGALTDVLLKGLKSNPDLQSLTIVEKDQTLAQLWLPGLLKERSQTDKNFYLERADFLDLKTEEWLKDAPLAVVSNLPYSAATAILLRLAENHEKIPVMVLMFQAEVAARLRAEPSTKERGSLSIWIQNRWDVKKLISAPRGAFTPPPDVNSEVVLLTRRDQPQVCPEIFAETPLEAEKLWERLLKTSFSHRRKMLRSFFPWQNALELSRVDGTKRAESLQWEEWNQLFSAVWKNRS